MGYELVHRTKKKIPYLKELGINAVEFLPLQEFYIDDFLINKGLTNYWGYNTIGFFAPESSYSTGSHTGCQVNEFKTLVRELHKEGIEVIMDVVYNHTGEGNELGPTICLKGIIIPHTTVLPAVLGGDELMRTQQGNNNAYCQDNGISWFDWDEVRKNSDILQFFKKAVAFTRRYTILQRRKFFLG